MVKAKHWQIFTISLITLYSPFLFHKLLPHHLAVYSNGSGLIFLQIWTYSVGAKLYSKLKDNRSFNFKIFQFLITFSIIFSIIFLSMQTRFLLLLIVFLNISFLYTWYLVAKALVSVELSLGKTEDTFVTFIRICIFPIGIWNLQPRLNTVFGKK